ncbi:retrovirus-related Pol polyprotein from transposon TNT 1-94 [Trichonephila clavipes]|nr:retrovirus-related Pol polyprotein from transposon TNT 1-94 [Trichonephila clavipes]
MKSKRDCVIFAENHLAKDCYYRNKNTLQVQAKETIRLEMDTYLQLPIEKKNFVTISGFWIVVHPVIWLKNLCGSKNISPEVMDIYLADKNSKMMSQGTGNVSAKTVSTKHCNSINLTITDVSYVPQLRCNLLSVTCLMDKGYHVINSRQAESKFRGDGVCVTPPGYEKLIGDDKVCKLKKSIYGLPQSGRNCYTKAFGNGSRNFEPWSRVTWTTPELAPSSPNYHTNLEGIFYQYLAGIFFEIHSSKIYGSTGSMMSILAEKIVCQKFKCLMFLYVNEGLRR